MSRTTRALPHKAQREKKTLDQYRDEWAGVGNGEHVARRMYRYNSRLGRDGGYNSNVYRPYTRAPGFIDRWADDGYCKGKYKRHYKRELAALKRRHAKKMIARALIWGDEA